MGGAFEASSERLEHGRWLRYRRRASGPRWANTIGRTGRGVRKMDIKMVPACDDFEICLELELTKKAPKAPRSPNQSTGIFDWAPLLYRAD